MAFSHKIFIKNESEEGNELINFSDMLANGSTILISTSSSPTSSIFLNILITSIAVNAGTHLFSCTDEDIPFLSLV